jgi:hypothetical protein
MLWTSRERLKRVAAVSNDIVDFGYEIAAMHGGTGHSGVLTHLKGDKSES